MQNISYKCQNKITFFNKNVQYKKHNRLLFLYLFTTNMDRTEATDALNTFINGGFLFATVGIIAGIISKQIADRKKLNEEHEAAFQKSKTDSLNKYLDNKKKEVEYLNEITRCDTDYLRLSAEEHSYKEQLYAIGKLPPQMHSEAIPAIDSLLLVNDETIDTSQGMYKTLTLDKKDNKNNLSTYTNNTQDNSIIEQDEIPLREEQIPIIVPEETNPTPVLEELNKDIAERTQENTALESIIQQVDVKEKKEEMKYKSGKVEILDSGEKPLEEIENHKTKSVVISPTLADNIYQGLKTMLMEKKIHNLMQKTIQVKEDIDNKKQKLKTKIDDIHKENEQSIVNLFSCIVQHSINKNYLNIPNNINLLSRHNIEIFVEESNTKLTKQESKMEKQLQKYEKDLFKDIFGVLQENLGVSTLEKYSPFQYGYDNKKFLSIIENYRVNGTNFTLSEQKYLAINAIKFLKDDRNSIHKFSDRVREINYVIKILQTNPDAKLSSPVMGAILSKHVGQYTKIVHKIERKTESFAMLLLLATVLKKMRINPSVVFDTNSVVEKTDYDSMFVYELIKDHQLFNNAYVLKMLENIAHFHRIEDKQGGHRNYTLGSTQYGCIMPQLLCAAEEKKEIVTTDLSITELLNIALVFFSRKEEYKNSLNKITNILENTDEFGGRVNNLVSALSNGVKTR